MTVTDVPATGGRSPHLGDASRRATSARLGVRLARRELRRRPWRTLLVLLLVFLPTTVMGAFVTVVRTTERSGPERVAARWGEADLSAGLVDGLPPSPEQLDGLRASLPAGSQVQVERLVRDRVRLGDRRGYFDISDLPLDDPTAAGRFGPVRGRLPDAPGEAVISTMASRDLGVEVGDSITPDRLGTRLTIVGTVLLRADGGDVVYTPGPLTDVDETRVAVDLPDDRGGPVGVPPTVDGWGLEPVGLSLGDSESGTVAVFWTYVAGGVGLVVLGTVITAAFAVGARRQLRSVGLLASSGASPSTVKWFLVAQGAVAGAVGSILGVGSAVLALRLVPTDVLSSVVGGPIEQVTARPADLVPIVVIGTVAASVAAWLPARSAAQVPTLQALAGRRPLPAVPRRLPVLGALSIGGGCALLAMAVAGAQNAGSSLWALVAIAGSLAVLLGAIATAPWVIAGLERASARLPLPWRLAGRSLARSRVRSSAVVGAVCAVSATLIAGATLYNSLNEPSTASVPYLRDDQLAVDTYGYDGSTSSPQPVPTAIRQRIDAIVPGARALRLPELVPTGQVGTAEAGRLEATYVPADDEDQQQADTGAGYVSIGIATPELLDLLAVPPASRAALGRGEAVGVSALPFESRTLRIGAPPGPAPVSANGSATVPLAGSIDSPSASFALPGALISTETAERLGLAARPGTTTLFLLPAPITERRRDGLQLLAEDLQWEQRPASEIGAQGASPAPSPQVYVSLNVPEEPPPVSPGQIRAGILAGSLLLVLAVVAVGLALAAKDGEDERQVLFAVGAPPRSLRRTGALRAVLLVAVAGLISAPAGLLPAAAIVAASEVTDGRQPTFRPDLWAVLFAVVVVPALVGLLTWSGGRLRDLARPGRPDVFAVGDS